LNTLTKDHDIPALAANFFDSERPLPSVRVFSLHKFYSPCSCNVATFADSFVALFFAGPSIPCFSSSFARGRTYSADPVSATSEAPEAEESQNGHDAEDSLEGTSSTMSPPPAHLEDPSLDRKRKRVEELNPLSTSTSKAAIGEPSAPNEDDELYDLLDS
jgi:hypothetical protein